jgi:hypothetical protein
MSVQILVIVIRLSSGIMSVQILVIVIRLSSGIMMTDDNKDLNRHDSLMTDE